MSTWVAIFYSCFDLTKIKIIHCHAKGHLTTTLYMQSVHAIYSVNLTGRQWQAIRILALYARAQKISSHAGKSMLMNIEPA